MKIVKSETKEMKQMDPATTVTVKYSRGETHQIEAPSLALCMQNMSAKHARSSWFPGTQQTMQVNGKISMTMNCRALVWQLRSGSVTRKEAKTPYSYFAYETKDNDYLVIPLAKPVSLTGEQALSDQVWRPYYNGLLDDFIKQGGSTPEGYYSATSVDSWHAVGKVFVNHQADPLTQDALRKIMKAYLASKKLEVIQNHFSDAQQAQEVIEAYRAVGLNKLWRDYHRAETKMTALDLTYLRRAYDQGDLTYAEVRDALRILQVDDQKPQFSMDDVEKLGKQSSCGQLDGIRWFATEPQVQLYEKDSNKLLPERLAQRLLMLHPVAQYVDQLAVWYRGKWYLNNAETQLQHLAQMIVQKSGCLDPKAQDGITKAMTSIRRTIITGDQGTQFDDQDEEASSKVQFRNGTLDPVTWKMEPLDPHDYIVNKTNYDLPFTDKAPTCPPLVKEWIQLLLTPGNDVSIQDAKKNYGKDHPQLFDDLEHDFNWICCYIGSMFTRLMGNSHKGTRMTFVVLLHGAQGQNGKSTFVSYIQKMIGVENISNLSLHAICSSRFMTANLRGKTANIFNDLPFTQESDTSTLKQCVGGDTLDTEMKTVQETRKFKPVASMLFTSNTLPALIDPSHGTARRMIDFEFSHEINEDFCKKFQLSQLEAEIPQFTAYCLWQLHRWLDDQGQDNPFALSATMKQHRDEWIGISNPTSYFFQTFIGRTDLDGAVISKKDLYTWYQLFVTVTRGDLKRALSASKFADQVEQQLHVTDGRPYQRDAISYHIKGKYINGNLKDVKVEGKTTQRKRVRGYAGLYLKMDAINDLLAEMKTNEFCDHISVKDPLHFPDIQYVASGQSLEPQHTLELPE